MTADAGAAPEEGWRRTSPLSFVVRAITGLRNLLFPAVALLFGSRGWDGGGDFVVPAIAGMVVISAVLTWIAWRHFRYRLGDEDIRVEHGLLSRSARTVPYERIQDVSLEQAPIARLFGMVEVRFETGAGGKDELKIGYVGVADADALRETVRARKGGEAVGAQDGAAVAAEPARLLFAMSPRRLALFGLFEFSLVVFAVLGGIAQQFDVLLPFDIWDFEEWLRLFAGPGHWLAGLGLAAQVIGAVLAVGTLAVVGMATGIVRTVLRDWGFRLEETAKGLRRRRGLLTRTDVVMPLHRVQALKITTGIIRRRFGWYGLGVVSLAKDAKSETHIVVPFATMREIAPVVETMGFALPDAETRWRGASREQRFDSMALAAAIPLALAAALAVFAIWAGNRFDAFPSAGPQLAVVGLCALGGFLTLREWHLWRHRRHAMDSRQLYAREGWLAPRLDLASRVKLQSVEIAQGPLARRRGYADLKFGIAGGTLEMRGLPLGEARDIRHAVLESIGTVDFSRLPG